LGPFGQKSHDFSDKWLANPMTTALPIIERKPDSSAARDLASSRQFASAFDRRELNAMDEAMLSVCGSLQSLGAPGFETQTIVWLRDGKQAEAIRTSIAQLSRLYPAICARLVPRSRSRSPFWQFRPDVECALQESNLSTADPADVLQLAARLLSMPRDLTTEDPIRFHLVHCAVGSAALIMQYSHALMDHTAAGLTLLEIDAIAAGRASQKEQIDAREQTGLIGPYLSGFSTKRRLQAAWRSWTHRMRGLRGEVAALHARTCNDTRGIFCIARRVLSEEQTRSVVKRVAATSGLPSVSMAVLGSLFRAMQRVSGGACTSQRKFVAGIGLDLGLRRGRGPIFQNGVSVVPVHASADQLEDRDALTQALNAQLRQQLTNHLDLGVVQLAALTRRFPGFVSRKTRQLLRDGYSLWYAYFGRMNAVKASFCGTQVDDVAVIAPAWSGPGLAVTVTQWQDRLAFQATYAPSIVSDQLLDNFLNVAIDDLIRKEE
jgi:hypothetical protein